MPTREPLRDTCARDVAGEATAALRYRRNSRRLVCRERSIVRGDGGRLPTPSPLRLEARSRLGEKAASELGAPAVSSIPARLRGSEPASARKGREDERAALWWNRCVAGPSRYRGVAGAKGILGHERQHGLERAHRAAAGLSPCRHRA